MPIWRFPEMGASFLCLCEYEPSKDNETFDVRIIDKEKELTVVVKSKGPLRNPLYKYSDEEIMDMDENNLRRAILSRLCKNINHKYMNGINCIYMNFSRNEASPCGPHPSSEHRDR